MLLFLALAHNFWSPVSTYRGTVRQSKTARMAQTTVTAATIEDYNRVALQFDAGNKNHDAAHGARTIEVKMLKKMRPRSSCRARLKNMKRLYYRRRSLRTSSAAAACFSPPNNNNKKRRHAPRRDEFFCKHAGRCSARCERPKSHHTTSST